MQKTPNGNKIVIYQIGYMMKSYILGSKLIYIAK